MGNEGGEGQIAKITVFFCYQNNTHHTFQYCSFPIVSWVVNEWSRSDVRIRYPIFAGACIVVLSSG